MTAKIIDGKALAARIQDELKTRVEASTEHGHRPGLAVVLVGEDPASQVYVRNKVRACERTGIRSDEIRMPAETTEAELLAVIDRLNHDDAVDGILVQLPLPKHLSSELVIAAISPEKDVDGFHVVSAGSLLTGRTGFRPCTPYGVMKLLEEAGCDPAGKHAVVIGRSNIVGKPAALMNKDDKVRAIRFLNNAGAFLVTKSGDKVAKYFGISKYTLYSYIDANKQQEEKKK